MCRFRCMLLVMIVWLLVVSVLVMVIVLLLCIFGLVCVVVVVGGMVNGWCRFSMLVLGSCVLLCGGLNSGVFYLLLLWVSRVYNGGGIMLCRCVIVSLFWLFGFCRLVYIVSLVSMLFLVV